LFLFSEFFPCSRELNIRLPFHEQEIAVDVSIGPCEVLVGNWTYSAPVDVDHTKLAPTLFPLPFPLEIAIKIEI
jgi:hypothetical protein